MLKAFFTAISLALLIFINLSIAFSQSIDTRIDNMGYWKQLAREGKIPFNKVFPVKKHVKIKGQHRGLPEPFGQPSPDRRIGDKEMMLSENSVGITADGESILVSSNSNPNPAKEIYGANRYETINAGEEWEGEAEGAGGENYGDPAIGLALDGTVYIGRIGLNKCQTVAVRLPGSQEWIEHEVSLPSVINEIQDKNHLAVDHSLGSPFLGSVYSAWTVYNKVPGVDGHVFLARSTDKGNSFSTPVNLSKGLEGISFNHGVNLSVGVNGEVYAIWSGYQNWPGDESAILFTRSTDGGATFDAPRRIGPQIRGVRLTGLAAPIRTNSFPVMAVDLSDGPGRGNLYIVWTNYGRPDENLGPAPEVYFIKSTNNGTTWSQAVRVATATVNDGGERFFPWITCDPVTGKLFVIFYDSRGLSAGDCRTWVAVSNDTGNTWIDFPVSDEVFTPVPIPGLAMDYFTDYIGISAYNDLVIPVWTDNREGVAASWCSPFRAHQGGQEEGVTIRRVQIFKKDRNRGYLSIDHVEAGMEFYLRPILVNPGLKTSQEIKMDAINLTPGIDQLTYFDTTVSINAGDSLVSNVMWKFKADTAFNMAKDVKIEFRFSQGSSDSPLFVETKKSNQEWKYTYFAPLWSSSPQVLRCYLSNESIAPNGIPDKGETFTINWVLTNRGKSIMPMITAKNILTDEMVSYPAISSLTIPELNPNDTIVLSFSAGIYPNIECGARFKSNLSLVRGNQEERFNHNWQLCSLQEDWEDKLEGTIPWVFSGDSVWVIDDQERKTGHYSLRSGTIGDLESTSLKLNYYLEQTDSLTFWVKTSTERNCDYLTFYVNDTICGSWSGIKKWEQVSFKLWRGFNRLEWRYSKDLFSAMGKDAVWIDDIVLPPAQRSIIRIISDSVMCNYDSTILLGLQKEAIERVRWKTDGDGLFLLAGSAGLWYRPGIKDREEEKVKIWVTGYGPLVDVVDTLHLSLPKEVRIKLDTMLCKYEKVELKTPEGSSDWIWSDGTRNSWNLRDYVGLIPGKIDSLRVDFKDRFGCNGSGVFTIRPDECEESHDPWFYVEEGYIKVGSNNCDPGYYLVELFDLGGALVKKERILHQGGFLLENVYQTKGKKGVLIGRITTPIGEYHANKVSF